MTFALPLHRNMMFTMVIKDIIAVQSLKQSLTFKYQDLYQRANRAVTLLSNTAIIIVV
jgi:hypothetical protein